LKVIRGFRRLLLIPVEVDKGYLRILKKLTEGYQRFLKVTVNTINVTEEY